MNLFDLLNGQKTRIAALLAIAVAVNEALKTFGQPHLTPDQQGAVIAVASAMGLWGVGHKLDKATDAVVTAGETAATHAANAATVAAQIAVAQATSSDKAVIEKATFRPTTHPADPELVLPPLPRDPKP